MTENVEWAINCFSFLADTLSSGAGRAANLESQGAECRFYISRKPVRYDFDVMAHRRNSIYRTPIDKALVTVVQTLFS